MVKPKSSRGLGLENLLVKRWALLAKWLGSFSEEREALWRKIIISKYGEDEWLGYHFLF